jgi:RHS repeat-associated protein
VAVAANAGQQAVVRRQNPYGNARGSNPAWGNDKGFLGGTNDNTGLTHTGAREYDPNIGRFVSVDPVFDINDPQSWSGYAYANNTPMTLSDASGLDTDCSQYAGADPMGYAQYYCQQSTGTGSSGGGSSGGGSSGSGGNGGKTLPATVDTKTGLCTSNCAPIDDAVDAWYADNGCDGSFGSIFNSACWSDRDDIERMIIGVAWQQQMKNNVADAPLYQNQFKGMLEEELAKADRLGVKPAKVGTPEFDAAIKSGRVKWAVLEDGTLVVVPEKVGLEEISHTVLSGGAPVAAAGTARIIGQSEAGYIGFEIDLQSGHFMQPLNAAQQAAAEVIGRNAFAMLGIKFL